jgi:hypothetical protein
MRTGPDAEQHSDVRDVYALASDFASAPDISSEPIFAAVRQR